MLDDTIRDLIARFQKLSPEDRVKAMLSMSTPDDQRFISAFFEQQCRLKDMQVLSPTSVKGTFAFKVERYYCNASGNLHGGAAATMYDMCTSLVLQAIGKKDFWLNGGVSRVLTVNYLRPAPEGTEVEMECEVTHAGRSLAFLRGVMKRASDGAIISTCEHNKAAVANKLQGKL